MTKPLTPTQERLAAYYATRPAFSGKPGDTLGGKAARQGAKRQAIRKTSGR